MQLLIEAYERWFRKDSRTVTQRGFLTYLERDTEANDFYTPEEKLKNSWTTWELERKLGKKNSNTNEHYRNCEWARGSWIEGKNRAPFFVSVRLNN